MNDTDKRDFATYPRRFNGYKWYKPLLVGLLFVLFNLICVIAIEIITKLIFSVNVSSTGYDDMDFFSVAGAFNNGATAAVVVPCLILAALIVKERPLSSYFSSMGGWRWKVFFRMFIAGFIIVGIPNIIWFSLRGKTGDVRLTIGSFLLLAVLIPFQSIGEEMLFRGYITQTVSSWFNMTFAGVIVQIVVFALVHHYNIIGVIEIAVSALIYALICLKTRGIESPSVMHIINNATEIFMVGFGFGLISAQQTVKDVAFNLTLKVLFFLFVLYADKKLHWFDEVEYDDVAQFNSKENR